MRDDLQQPSAFPSSTEKAAEGAGLASYLQNRMSTASDHSPGMTPPDLAAENARWRWLPHIVFAVAALAAVLPLILHGCSCGHDFDFHLLSWMEAASQWQHGILKPVWAFTPAFNAGEPRLLMYPPLSWATGAALGMVLPWPAVPIAFTGLALFLSAVTMHRLLRRWTSPANAMLGGCLYMVNPYMLFCAYERAAYAELMAAAWMPLLLAAMLRPRISMWRVTLVVALLWITNVPAAVVGTYSILVLGLTRLVMMRKQGLRPMLHVAWTITSGFCVGLLLDAFYLLPMAVTRKFVQLALAVVPIASPDANFLFGHDNDAFHDHVLTQASWIGVATVAVAIVCGCVVLWLRSRERVEVRAQHSMKARDAEMHTGPALHSAVLIMTGFSAFLWFLLSRFSSRIWHLAPELVFLQFPWRFLTIASAVMVALLVLLLQRGIRRVPARVMMAVALPIVALAGYFAGGRYFREECASDETVQAQRAQYVNEDGVGPTDEYTPAEADNDALPIHLPPAWLTTDAAAEPGKSALLPVTDRSHPEDVRFSVASSAGPESLVVRLRAFPGWHTLRDGVEIMPQTRADGLTVVPLTGGAGHTVEIRYRTTVDEWAGMGVSAATLLTLAGTRRRRSGIMRQPA